MRRPRPTGWVQSRHVGEIASIFFHGTGRVARKPALEAYDLTFYG